MSRRAIDFKRVIKIKLVLDRIDTKYTYRKPFFGKEGWYEFSWGMFTVYEKVTFHKVQETCFLSEGFVPSPLYVKPYIKIYFEDSNEVMFFNDREKASLVYYDLIYKHGLTDLTAIEDVNNKNLEYK